MIQVLKLPRQSSILSDEKGTDLFLRREVLKENKSVPFP